MMLTCRDSDIGRAIVTPEVAKAIFLPMMLPDRETLVVMCLDDSRRVINAFVASIGTVDMVECQPRAVFAPALVLDASYILIAHNHPSGDPTPSQMDILTTRNLELCAQLLGIGFVDHLVLTTSGKYRSIAEYMERGF